MKKRSLFLAAFLALSAASTVGLTACGGGEEPAPNMLFDTKFEKGIYISSLQSAENAYSAWRFADTTGEPFWKLGQYGDLSTTRDNYDATKNSLSLGGLFTPNYGIKDTTDEGVQTLTNQSGSKFISVDTATGTVNLNVDTSKEYVNQATGATQVRANGEDWVHMILSQQSGTVYLSQVESFVMELDFTLTCNDVYDSSIGAAQFQWIFSVRDMVIEPVDYFWFNVTLFDNRYTTTPFPGTQMVDSGKADATGKFIYAPTGQDLFGSTGGLVQVGTKYHVELDLLAHMRAAFDKAQELGALQRSDWENMAISDFNLGWEVSNLSKVGVEISNLALRKKDK